ncbi:MAG: hypothetical protein KQI35_01330 [Bacteroidetes bacterium]|nr:hypothetical protein [Bacteroidota bacterium]
MKNQIPLILAAFICCGLPLTSAAQEIIPYTQNFENVGLWPDGWSTNNSNVWSFSTNWYGTNNPGGYNVYSDYTPYEAGTVYSPTFNGSSKSNIHVKFYHYWQANYSGGTQDGYLYGSNNGGFSYNFLIDEWHHNDPATEEGEKVYDISSWADGYSNIAFKWVVFHNNDYYWQFDNFEIYEAGVPGLWTGTVSSSWTAPGNWDDLQVPNSTVDVVISGGTPYSPHIGAGTVASCRNLTVNYSGTLTQSGLLVNNSYLNVYGSLNTDYGNFTQTDYSYLYFRGDGNVSWDDDNMNDTYRNVRIIKSNPTDNVSLYQHMTIQRNLEIQEGTLLFNDNWTLTINSTASNALEVEYGGALKLANNQTIDVAGDVQFLNGSNAIVTGGLIKCAGDFRVMDNIYFNIQFTGGTLEMDGSSTQYIEDQDGNSELYNLTINKSSGTCMVDYADLDLGHELMISSGTLDANGYDIYIGGDWINQVGTTGFTEGTGRVIFDGGNYHQYCSTETFNELEINKASGGALRISGNDVICAAYDWTAGAIDVLSGSFTANDLIDNGLFGAFYLNTGGIINLTNMDGQVGLNGDLYIYGGTMNVYGGVSYSGWPIGADAIVTMTGGVLDFHDQGIWIYPSSFYLTENITGGTIRTSKGFWFGSYFAPSGGTVEFYGSDDCTLYQPETIYGGLHNVIVNKSGKDSKSNTLSLSGEVVISNDLTISAGTLNPDGYDLYIGGDWTNNAGDAGFDQSTGTVFFNGTGPAMQSILTDESFNILHNSSATGIQIDGIDLAVTCNGYDWSSGSLEVLGATFTAYDLVTNGLYGTFSANYNAEIVLHQDATHFIDLYGNFQVQQNSVIEVHGGGDDSFWSNGVTNNVEIATGGIIDFVDWGIEIWNNGTLNDIITDGTIRTSGDFMCYRTDFDLTGGMFEFYGGSDAQVNMIGGSSFNNVMINKSGGDESMVQHTDRDGSKTTKTKGNTVTLLNDLTLNGGLTISNGDLILNGHQLSVQNDFDVYGILTMSDPADVLELGTYGELEFYSGSTGNIANGEIFMQSWLATRSGCSFIASTNSTIHFVDGTGVTYGGLSNFEPSTVYGNIVITKTNEAIYLSSTATEPHLVNGDFTISSGSTLQMQDRTLIVHGNFTDNATSEIYLNSGSDGSAIDFSDKVIQPGQMNGKSMASLTDTPKNSKSKGGYLEMDSDFILNGLMDVDDGDVLVHGDFGIASTGELTINGGSFIADKPFAKNDDPGLINEETQSSKDWQYIYGTLNLTDGLFEISHNSFNLAPIASTNISGGTIRIGGSFQASLADNFQPTGGIVELVGDGPSDQMIVMKSSNHFHDLVINRINPVLLVITELNALFINNDFTILGGGLDTDIWDVKVGGDWTNTAGPDAFVEGSNTVYFRGVNDAEITTNEIFYGLALEKSPNIELTLSGDVTVLESLAIICGDLHTGPHILDVHNDVQVKWPSTLFVEPGGTLKLGTMSSLTVDAGAHLYVIGSASDYAKITHSGEYYYWIEIFGEIAANYAIFEFLWDYGIVLQTGAMVNPVYSFNQCIFQNPPFQTYLPLYMNIRTSCPFTATDVYFEIIEGGTFSGQKYNVMKSFDSTGDVFFQSATGDFAGPEFEDDPNNLVHWTDMDVSLNLNVMLEGPFNGTDMNTDLNTQGLIPNNQPFNSNTSADWYYTGTETVDVIFPNVTDWVLIELRDASSPDEAMPENVVAKQAALLLNDGSIVDLDGTSNLYFPGLDYSSGLYPVIWHRNHLGIISSYKMRRINDIYTYDFTEEGSAYSNGNPGEKLLGGNVWGMMGGDSNGSGLVATGDLSNDWTPAAGKPGYKPADFNLDGQLDNKDKNDIWYFNLLKSSQIPGSKKLD